MFSCDNLKSCALYRFDTVHVAGSLRTAFLSNSAPRRQQLLISQTTTVILSKDIVKPAVTAHASFDIRYFASCGPGSSVGIATDYGLDDQGIESRWGRDFPRLSRPALGHTQPPVQWVPGLSRGKERPGRDADPSLPSSAVVKKE